MSEGPHHDVTFRAIALGALLALAINLACPYSVLLLQNAGLTSDYITAGAMMLFLVLVGLINPVLKRLRTGWGLSSVELIVVFAMMVVACAIPTWGLVTNLFHILTRPFYYATPENGWVDLVHPLIPSWLAPRDPDVARYFYEGLPAGQGIPWSEWAVPMLAWGSAMLAVFVLMVCTMVILRRPWVEQERLVFPLTQLPLEMLRGVDDHAVPPLFRNRLLWAGFAIPFALQMLRGLHHYYFFIPEIETYFDPIPLFRNSVRLRIFVNFAIIGLSYFLNLHVAFSVWFFHVLGMCQTGVFHVVGYELPGRHESLTASSPALSHQGMGAIIVLVAAILWTARRHLARVLGAAVRWRRDAADAEEILSYRAAVWLWTACAAYYFVWLLMSGMPPLTAIVFLLAVLTIFVAVTRVIAQGGVGFTASTMVPQPFAVYTLGTDLIGWKGLASLSLSYSWAGEMRTTVMASTANGLKLAHTGGLPACRHPRRLFWAILVAIVVSMAGATWMTMHLSYTYGGINLRQFGVPSIAYRFLEDKLVNPIGWETIKPRLLFTAIGGAVMGLLIHLQHRLPWWPLHYIGLPIGDSWVMGRAWFSVFLGWLLKAIIFRFWGSRGYHFMKPVFLGFVAGQLMGAAVWMVVDAILGETGNVVYVGVR